MTCNSRIFPTFSVIRRHRKKTQFICRFDLQAPFRETITWRCFKAICSLFSGQICHSFCQNTSKNLLPAGIGCTRYYRTCFCLQPFYHPSFLPFSILPHFCHHSTLFFHHYFGNYQVGSWVFLNPQKCLIWSS